MFRALLVTLLCLLPVAAAAQGQSTLRVTVRDETQAALIHAVVTLIAPTGAQGQALVDESGNAHFGGLAPGVYQVRVEAEGFQGYTVPFTVKRGANSAIATLTVAIREEVIVKEQSAESRRDNGFTTTLTADDIAGLSDDPDEMAEQLMQMAGPGAQIFVDGFRGGRLPPKDQIQQIRFQTNSYAAEYHEAGMVRIEVTTRPGMGNWRGSFNFGFRDESLNATNAFASEQSPEQQKRFMFNSQGPIVKGKTSLAISADGNMSYDAQTIVAQTPDGEFRDQIRRPVEAVNASVRLEQAISPTNSLRAEYARRDSTRKNLGVGDFDLAERAYENETTNDMLRVRNTRTIGKKLFSELRVELSQAQTTLTSSSTAPTLRVLDNFTSGGAGQSGGRTGRLFTVAQNFDFAIAKHMLRAGLLLESGWWDSTTATNTNGTYTFSSLPDFDAGRASTFQRRVVEDPDVSYSQHQAGWFAQDDFRITKRLTVSLGLRQEIQTNLDDNWNFAPRGAFTWSIGKGNVRGGYGIFYDWFEANTYEQTVLVDGTNQRDQIVVNPSYPIPSGDGTVLPPSRIELGPQQTQPTIQQASIGYDRAFGEWGNFRTDYMMLRGSNVLRSVNVNAPFNGVRPDPRSGNVNEIRADGERAFDRFTAGMMLRVPNRRMMGNVMYQYGNARNSADSALSLPSNNLNPDADWGPAANDIRHRLFFMANTPLAYGVRASMQAQYSSAPPYNITTGLDDNGDTVFNDRPAGVGRNSARGASQWNVNFRVNRQFNLGGLLGDGPVMLGPPPPPPSTNAQRGPTGGAGDGGGGRMQMIMEGNVSRYRLDLYFQVFNLFNTVNLNQFVGNQLSTYFGTATSAAPPRRIEIGASLSF